MVETLLVVGKGDFYNAQNILHYRRLSYFDLPSKQAFET